MSLSKPGKCVCLGGDEFLGVFPNASVHLELAIVNQT